MMHEGLDRKEIRLAGFGGQGVILAGLVLGQAAVNGGLYAAGSSSYGAQARGSACRADLVLAGKRLDYPHLERADILVAMSQGAYDAYAQEVAPDGIVLFDSGPVTVSDRGRGLNHGLEVTTIAVNELQNKQVANLTWVGVVAGFTDLFTRQALEEAVRLHLPERFLHINLQALAHGLRLGEPLKRV
jgi:2-oxoglutarate ferredoxin oxidoreductase subunit gamma